MELTDDTDIDLIAKTAPTEPTVLAAPSPPLRNGSAVRRIALDRNGHPTRRQYGIVVDIRDKTVGVYWERTGMVSWVFPDELEPTKHRLFDRLQRKNARLQKVVAKVLAAKRASAEKVTNPSMENHDRFNDAVEAMNKALVPYERESA